MKSYNEIFEKNKEQKFYVLINSNMNLLLEPYTRTVFEELIHLNNIRQKISVRTLIRLTRISNKTVQQAIKTLRQLNIIGDKGYNLNLERIEAIYTTLNSIIKLDDKLAYCDSLLSGTNEAIETIQQEEEEVQEEEPIYNKVEQEEQEQPTIDIEATTIDMQEQPTIQEPIQEPKEEEEEVINNNKKEVMNKEEEVHEQAQSTVPTKQELEKNAYILLNKMMQCDSKKDWAVKQDKLFNYIAQNNTWSKEELNRITSALIESKTMWEQEQYHKAMSLINAVQCGV